MHEVVLLIGGNLGNREELLAKARGLLAQSFSFKDASSIYETAAWGGHSQGYYLNQAVLVETKDNPETVLAKVQGIEEKLDRKRERIWGDRTMDIDIIYYDDLVLETGDLTVPHPLLQERRFVLVPICEILPAFLHPVFHKTQAQLLETCEDESEVRLWENPAS